MRYEWYFDIQTALSGIEQSQVSAPKRVPVAF
jgi:hypothetical protein